MKPCSRRPDASQLTAAKAQVANRRDTAWRLCGGRASGCMSDQGCRLQTQGAHAGSGLLELGLWANNEERKRKEGGGKGGETASSCYLAFATMQLKQFKSKQYWSQSQREHHTLKISEVVIDGINTSVDILNVGVSISYARVQT